MNEFLSKICLRDLENKHVKNLKKVAEISKDFHRKAKIPTKKVKICKDSVVLESGHQPNFFPYAGVWRKVFLLDYISKRLTDIEKNPIPIFGLFDFNLCTTKLLFQNRVPAVNKNGFITIGLKRPSGSKMWLRFDVIEKPSEKEWESVIRKIEEIYKDCDKDTMKVIIEEMWKSYELGETLSDVNAIMFSRFCNIFGFDVLFFKYSDIQRIGLFLDKWESIVSKLKEFNGIHNEIVKRKKLEKDLGLIEENSAPFWYHCECGAKVQMYYKDGFFGTCPICKKEHRVESLADEFKNLSPKAVLRNLVFSEGLRTTLFISGIGGGLKYGLVADEIANRLGLNSPTTLVWIGKDYYLGLAHRRILSEIMKFFDMKIDDVFDVDSMFLKIKKKRLALANLINKSKKKHMGQYLYSDTQIKIAERIFSTTSSIIDIAITVGFKRIVSAWINAIERSKIKKDTFYRIEDDICYEDMDLPKLYETIRLLNDRSKEIDPLGLLRG